jgi:hypothetical protein
VAFRSSYRRRHSTPDYLRSLRRVAEKVGFTPGVDHYREVSAALRAGGEDVAPFGTLHRYFDRSWPRVREALDVLSVRHRRKTWQFRVLPRL